MRTHKIRLRVDEVKDFVAAATRCDFDIDISYNRFEFEDYLNHFAIAC